MSFARASGPSSMRADLYETRCSRVYRYFYPTEPLHWESKAPDGACRVFDTLGVPPIGIGNSCDDLAAHPASPERDLAACDVVLTSPESMKAGERRPSILAFEESPAFTWIAF